VCGGPGKTYTPAGKIKCVLRYQIRPDAKGVRPRPARGAESTGSARGKQAGKKVTRRATETAKGGKSSRRKCKTGAKRRLGARGTARELKAVRKKFLPPAKRGDNQRAGPLAQVGCGPTGTMEREGAKKGRMKSSSSNGVLCVITGELIGE